MRMGEPVAYISYAWGEDDTPEGREREAIVDDLCRSFDEVGIVIGRDMNDAKPGDSIEDYGKRIAKAPVILAVISHKSLRSDYCMVYELYEAYVRCGKNYGEFRERVAALVLEDAETDLKTQMPLIEFWEKRAEELNAVQMAADSEREESLESFRVVNKCKAMIKALPNIFKAINDIAMPRGSAAIRQKNFAVIRKCVQEKLEKHSSAVHDIPSPPELDLASLQIKVLQLHHQHSALSSRQVHGAWHDALQAIWPMRSAASLFPQLPSRFPLEWTDLLSSLEDPRQWQHLDKAKVEFLFENFAARLEQGRSPASAGSTDPLRPSLAVLVKSTGGTSSEGHAVYSCSAVLRIPEEGGGWHYEQVDEAADHEFCFHRPGPSSDRHHPGTVLGGLWRAATARLCELGRNEPFLDLFLPRGLLDEDWSTVELEDGEDEVSLNTKCFRLRSIERWTNPTLLVHKQHFDRKHTLLAGRQGHWALFPGDAASSDLHQQLSNSRNPSTSDEAETVAILQCGSLSSDLREREKFYRSAIESSAPVVLWWHPSNFGQPDNDKKVNALCKSLNLVKPTKTKHHRQKVERNPLDLPAQTGSLPIGLVALIEDSLDMDPERPGATRLFSVMEQARTVGYRTG
jgi:hypothetical protein